MDSKRRLRDTVQGQALEAAHVTTQRTIEELDRVIGVREASGPRRSIRLAAPSVEDSASRVLVVDDETSILHVAERYLQAHGHRVALASSIDQAAELVVSRRIGCAVWDWRFPDGAPVTGIALCRQRDVPVCVMTGYQKDVPESLGVQVFEKGQENTWKDLVAWVDRVMARTKEAP